MQEMDDLKVFKIPTEEYKKLHNFPLEYGISQTKFGNVLLAMNEDKICHISFTEKKTADNNTLVGLKSDFPNALLKENNDKVIPEIENIFLEENNKPVNILLKGTDFEMKVWEKLVSLKKGSTFSYEDVAKLIGNPKAIRAVARAIAKNRLAFIVPCHRVISKSGGLSKYRYGANRKFDILKAEKAV